jgi:hypothetical protein
MGTGESGNYYTSGGSSVVHHEAIIHSIDGEYVHDSKTGRPTRLRAGGHGQASMTVMARNGIEFNVVKTYENGVRVGNVPRHKATYKTTGIAQAWFPKSWTVRDIVKAGEHVVSLKSNQGAKDGSTMWGTYKGVHVGALKTNGKVATVFPDIDQSGVLKRRHK